MVSRHRIRAFQIVRHLVHDQNHVAHSPLSQMRRSTRRSAASTDGKENQPSQAPSKRARVTPPSSKKARHRLSTTELARLEDVFKQDTHPSRQQKRDLAAQLGMDYKTVTIWFQNKRQTSKRGQPPAERSWRRARADSCLRTVSSPSHNATLASEAATDAPVPSKDTIVSKAIVKIKPLLDALNVLTSRSSEPAENTEAKDEVSDITDVDPYTPLLSPDNTTEPEPDQEDEAAEHAAKPVIWKRARTLEWACERHAKRRKMSREGYVRLASEEVQDDNANDAHMDSALSLLSLAASTHASTPEDVIRGASLLLNFKHSWGRKQQDLF